jgi:spore germination cell wall hydrolase CwlJ-like protein
MEPVLCLATAIFFEARDQPMTGQEMVAEVVMNRVDHDRFPDNVCDVVYQFKAFSFTHDGKSDDMLDYNTHHDKQAQALAMAVAKDYRVGHQRLGSPSTHYHTLSVAPFWSKSFVVDGIVGDHIFYTCDGYC